MEALEMTGEWAERIEKGEKAGCSKGRNDSQRNRGKHDVQGSE